MKKLMISSLFLAALFSGQVLADTYVCTTALPMTFINGDAKPTQNDPNKITTVITESEDQIQLNIGNLQYFYPKITKNIYYEGKVMVSKYFKSGQIVFGVIESDKDIEKSSKTDLNNATLFGGCKTGTPA